MKKVEELNGSNFEQEVLQAKEPVLVDFYAPWCGPCKMMAPALDALATEMDGQARVVKVNVDDAGELAMKYQITGVPTFILFHKGQVAETVVGAVPPATLKAKLQGLVQA